MYQDNVIRVDIKGYALVAWDEKGVPCLSWSTVTIVNHLLAKCYFLPLHSRVFRGILNRKLSTTEDLKNE